MSHYKMVCNVHRSIVVGQCRCPGPSKVIHYVDCPGCKEDSVFGQYKQKPIVVQAVKFSGNNLPEVEKLVDDDVHRVILGDTQEPMLAFRQDGKEIHVVKGDWLVKGNGRLEVMSDDEFQAHYEPTEQQRG